MRWTQENEEILWQTVFRTHSFHMDLTKIAQEWPGDDKPTPKALKEHLTKYRKSLGGDGRITFGMTGLNAAGTPTGTPRKKGPGPTKKGGDSAPATPQKRGAREKGQALEETEETEIVVVKKEEVEPTTADEDDTDESDDVKVHTPKRIKKEIQDDGFP
ncbi:uncharacterized protein APUU_11936A [Aspergillus puulaauensis]|uniref:Uncharacterized protein n=1 Tax=Aspergillus puulaauensis TaxID=1220207 RepID=A0A7R7XD87_9EURO|nr:uncharacterized protein APUU_11936A [Aspergillus puulaauensis]BCS19108.1 hypothetical protein APUU_11936A [Aspergillus puulaauensis]